MNDQSTPKLPTWQEFHNEMIVKALKDEIFRQELIADPKAVLEKEMGKVKEGIKLPAAWEVKVIEQPANALYLVLPAMSGDELSDNNLHNDGHEQTMGVKRICFTLLVGMLILSSAGCSKSAAKPQSQLEGYPIASDVFTTRQKTVVPDSIPSGSEKVFPYEITKYKQNGYGSWHYGPGMEFVKRLDIMPTTYSGTSASNTAKLLNFFIIAAGAVRTKTLTKKN